MITEQEAREAIAVRDEQLLTNRTLTNYDRAAIQIYEKWMKQNDIENWTIEAVRLGSRYYRKWVKGTVEHEEHERKLGNLLDKEKLVDYLDTKIKTASLVEIKQLRILRDAITQNKFSWIK